ncbi:MAG: hypothetical protein M3R38_34395 [Actinomycetota bacterium]|nr:hypothetical protein [Actinomycetota bacterium]
MKLLKLTVDPVPVISAGKSLNALLSSSRWTKIRRAVYAAYGHRCAICGSDPKALSEEKDPWKLSPEICLKERERYGEEYAAGIRAPKYRLECHEEWRYDEEAGTQGVADLLALCTPCHQVKHWNWAATKLRMPPELLKKLGSWEVTHKEAMQETRRLFEESLLAGDARAVEGYLIKGRPYYGVWTDAEKFAQWQQLNADRYFLEEHFMWVNGCGLDILVAHVEEAAELCFRRSLRYWRVDFGEFA